MPPYVALTGWAACLLHGAALLDGRAVDGTTELPVGVVVGTRGSMRRDPAIALSFEVLREWEVVIRYGVRVAAFVRARRSARRWGVVEWAVARARGGVRTPMEVRVRTIAEEDAGWPRLLVNRVVLTTDGTRIGEVDLIDDDAEAAIEVDGADHRGAERQAWDITKEEALRQVGFEVTRVTGRQAMRPSTPGPGR